MNAQFDLRNINTTGLGAKEKMMLAPLFYHVATNDEGLVLGVIQDKHITSESEHAAKYRGGMIAGWIEQGFIVQRVNQRELIRALRKSQSLLQAVAYDVDELTEIPAAEAFELSAT